MFLFQLSISFFCTFSISPIPPCSLTPCIVGRVPSYAPLHCRLSSSTHCNLFLSLSPPPFTRAPPLPPPLPSVSRAVVRPPLRLPSFFRTLLFSCRIFIATGTHTKICVQYFSNIIIKMKMWIFVKPAYNSSARASLQSIPYNF